MYNSLIAAQDPKRIAIEGADGALTYGQLDGLTAKRPDPKPFIARQDLASIVHLLSLWRHGFVACPLSHRLPPKEVAACCERMKGAKGFATLLMTSGTTGRSKIAAHSFENHLASARAMVNVLKLEESSRYFLNLPLFHVAGIAICIRTFLAGATLVLEGVEDPTHISAVPAQLPKMKSYPQMLLVGGGPLPNLPEQALGSYGMTEMSSTVAVGRKWLTPLSNIELKIDESGEILVRGPALFQGYFEKGELTLPLKDGWFATRDLGRWNNEGQFEWMGRCDRLIISGGENIQPEEIEQALSSLPGVHFARVEAKADPLYGMRPVAHVETDGRLSEEEIKERLKEALPAFKIPDQILINRSLTGSGMSMGLPLALETDT